MEVAKSWIVVLWIANIAIGLATWLVMDLIFAQPTRWISAIVFTVIVGTAATWWYADKYMVKEDETDGDE